MNQAIASILVTLGGTIIVTRIFVMLHDDVNVPTTTTFGWIVLGISLIAAAIWFGCFRRNRPPVIRTHVR